MLQYDDMSFDVPAWDGVARHVAELWRMHREGHAAVCSVWTHPEGAQLRLTVDGTVLQTEATDYLFALPTVALAWKERWHWLKGWR